MFKYNLKSIRLKLKQGSKHIYQDYLLSKSSNKKLILIIGCQRSGTTMLSRIFEKDSKVRNFGEKSILSDKDERNIRLNTLPEIKAVLDKKNAPIMVVKPLVESQNTNELLNFFPNSYAIWAYRNYKDVASSNLKKFGDDNGINNLRPIVNNEQGNWRSEKVSDETRKVVMTYFSEQMAQADAAALFWYVRNILLFECHLHTNKRVLLCKYEDLVTNPKGIIGDIYSYLDLHSPSQKMISGIHPSSIAKGKNLKLSPEIKILCEDLLIQLNTVYQKQNLSLNNSFP